MNRLLLIFAGISFLVACDKETVPDYPEWPDQGETVTLLEPEECDNIVVAHRGGSTEAGTTNYPDNSLASLRYTIDLGCYASECDIYWTSDDQVIIAHADSYCYINNLHPWEHTLEEIRAAGGLTNGETLPSLEDFLEVIMSESKCTKLWLDIKNITYPSTLTDYPIAACRRACEIIAEYGAQNFVEFICTGNSTVMASCYQICKGYGINIGWMGNQTPDTYKRYGYSWANLSIDYMSAFGSGSRSVEEFYNAGIEISVYNADSDDEMSYFINRADMLKALCTNYPKALLNKMK